MRFDKDVYPEEMREKLEQAVLKTAEEYVGDKIEEGMECEGCGSQEMTPEVKEVEEEYLGLAVCENCGEEQDMDVEVNDLRSVSPF